MLNNPMTPPAGGQMPQSGDPPGQMPTTPPQGQMPPGGNQHQGTLPPFESLPPEVQDHIKDLRKQAKTYREQLEARQKAEADAEAERLKKQGEYQKLAEQHETRVKELEPIATRYQSLAELVSEQIKAETKDWPQSVKALDPGKDAPIEERLAWKNRAAAIVAELATTARGTLPGNRPNPAPAGQPSREELIAANRKELQKSRTYGI